MREQLTDIIENQKLSSLFQPIVCLGQKNIFAFEALIRGPSDSPLHNPLNLFSAAERFNQTLALEQACRRTSIKQFSRLKLEQKLFLNVSPEVFLDPQFKQGETLEVLNQAGISASRVVIEITEHQPTDNYQLMRDAIAHYRQLGFEIALDDLGAGYSSLRLWTELMPDYVKIDRHFIQDIDKDPIKLNFVRSIQSMAAATNCRVIAEGVETQAEYQAIEKIGVQYSQGYYFARPEAEPIRKIDVDLFKSELLVAQDSSTTIAEIIQQIVPISPSTNNSEVLDIFQKNNQITMLPLIAEEGNIKGLLYKDQFLTRLFASRYGMELYGREPVHKLVDVEPFVFEQDCAIEDVSQQLTNTLRTDQAFIITENGRYKGIATVMDLLQLITTQQLQNAQHANPLTLLPGITPMNNIINRKIADDIPFTIGYFDLDNFKPFNDTYGYDKGDQAIKLVANYLQDTINGDSGHVGHIGGDDFIVIFYEQDWENSCKQVLSSFKQAVADLYSEEHRLAQGIQTVDRKGNQCFYPLLSLSIGIVEASAIAHCQSHIEIADLAAEAKHQAKKIVGNSYFINRRIPGESVDQHSLYSYVA